MKPIILITTPVDDEKNIRLANSYVHAVESLDALPLIIPPLATDELINSALDIANGVIFSGGADVEPIRYSSDYIHEKVHFERNRDNFEFNLLSEAIKKELPILAICRGMQLVNIAFGGTLYQDIPDEYPSAILHSNNGKDAYHTVSIKQNTPLYSMLGKSTINTNSYHHQAVRTLGGGLLPMASAEDGITEAAYHGSYRYLRLYQWHPERQFDNDDDHVNIFKDFIAECKRTDKVH